MDADYRTAVASRVLAAVIGGYVATGIATAAMAAWLPMSTAEATHLATLLSFVIYVLVVLAVFHVSSAGRAWGVIAAVGGVAGLAFIAGGAQ